MAWLQTHGQLAATVKDAKGRDLPTHLPQAASGMLTERLAKVSGEGLRAMDIRERGPREAFLSKIFGSIQGIAISTLSADAVRHLTRDNATDIVVKLLVSGLGPAQTLSSFFAAMQSKPEATKAGVGRFAVAQLNVIDADRASLPHTTEAGTAARRGENLYHSVRGILQIPNQAAVEASATAAQWAINATTATTNAAFSISATAFKAANRHFRKAMVGEPTQQQDVELGRPNTEVRPAS